MWSRVVTEQLEAKGPEECCEFPLAAVGRGQYQSRL